MKLLSGQSGDFNLKIGDDISALQFVSTNKVTGGNVRVTKHGAGGQRAEIVQLMPLLLWAELSNHGIIQLQTSSANGTDFTAQLSESGNIAIRGDEYLLAEFTGVTLDAGTLDIYGVEEYMTTSEHNVVAEVQVLSGMKTRSAECMGADEIALPVDSAMTSVEFTRGATTISLTQAEIKAQARRYRPYSFYQQNSTNDYGFKDLYLLPLQNAEMVKVHTDGSKSLSIYLNYFG